MYSNKNKRSIQSRLWHGNSIKPKSNFSSYEKSHGILDWSGLMPNKWGILIFGGRVRWSLEVNLIGGRNKVENKRLDVESNSDNKI